MTWTCEAVEQGVQTLPPAVFQLRRKDGTGYWWHRCDCTYIKYKMLYLKNDPVKGWIAAKKVEVLIDIVTSYCLFITLMLYTSFKSCLYTHKAVHL